MLINSGIYSLIHQYSQSIYYVLGTVTVSEDRAVNIKKKQLKFSADIKNEMYLYVLLWKDI